MSRGVPSTTDFLLALAAGFEQGAPLVDTLALIARAGPASAKMARRLSEELRHGSFAKALKAVELIDDEGLVALAEECGKLPPALRYVSRQRRFLVERRRSVRNAVVGPLVLALAGLAAEPLPQLALGAASVWTLVWPPLLLLGLAALAHRLLPRVPLRGSLATLDGEASAAAMISIFAEGNQLGLAPRAARAAGLQPWADALAVAAADPKASVPTFSEPFALALQVGLGAADLPSRFATIYQESQTTLTSRLRTFARVTAFSLLAVVALHGAWKLFSSPLPGLGGDLNSPELKDLERELENAGH